MYIYLDDSGNIDNEKGNLYVWAGFSIPAGYLKLKAELDAIFQNYTYSEKDGELKGKNADPEQKKRVFECLTSWEDLRISYLVTDKSVVTPTQSKFVTGALSRSKEQSENYFLSKVITRLSEPYPGRDDKRVVINIDGKPARNDESKIRLHEYLSLRVNYPKWNRDYAWNNFVINYSDEKNHGLYQAADFLANFFLEYYKYVYYRKTKNRIQSAINLELYNMLLPKVSHRIYGLPNTSLL
ncbi:DUF3800 domain-containing protein [Priestia aryabhattai]|uniref:DUF3800 domain-containing protein n=1 Tax=Priestia aryabhattai TaxID=412384 RepID=UPI001C8E6C71|nr:DUF3800 domain-containing protein [Priestia aryabhattai]MBX9968906.1 DUF3800 domain-containing protein [Priestia aryabhattai]